MSADQSRPAEEWLRHEPVRLLRDYVRIDTRPDKGEKAGAEFLRDLLDCPPIQTEIVCPAPGRCNLLARLPGRRREGALLLVNHIDVVDVVPQLWVDSAPFEGKIKNGFLYGRGVYDMKSLAIAQALALRGLAEQGVVPNSDILFLAEADEEIGQKWGARWLLEHRPEWFSGVGQILNEGGTNEMVVREPRFWGLETLQAGYALAEFEAAGAAPLEALASRWPRLAAPPVEPHEHVREAFGMLANHLPSPYTDPLRHLDRVRKDPAELAILPDRYAAFLEPRIHWSTIYRYPPTGESKLRRYAIVSTPPGISPDPFLQPVTEDARKAGLVVVETQSSGLTGASAYPTSFTDLLARVTEARYPRVPFGPMPTYGGYTTSILFRQKGFPTYGYSPIPMNITDSSRRHGNDERVFLRDFLNGVELYGEILREFAASR